MDVEKNKQLEKRFESNSKKMKERQKKGGTKNPADDLQGNKGAGFAAKTQYPVQRLGDNKLENIRSTANEVLGHNFNNVKVELNSSDPAGVGAVATAQNKTVKVAPSHSDLTQRKNVEVVGHELRHTQQQAEGKVKANTRVGNVPVNNERRHESDADNAGKKIADAMRA